MKHGNGGSRKVKVPDVAVLHAGACNWPKGPGGEKRRQIHHKQLVASVVQIHVETDERVKMDENWMSRYDAGFAARLRDRSLNTSTTMFTLGLERHAFYVLSEDRYVSLRLSCRLSSFPM